MTYNTRDGIGAEYKTMKFEHSSGVGSHPTATKEYCKELMDQISSLPVTGIVDYGCGNMETYRTHISWNELNVPYVGYDISDVCLAELRKRYQQLRFELSETETSIPVEADHNAIIIKDVLIHWYDHHIKEFFENVFDHYEYVFYMHQTTQQGYNVNPTNERNVSEYFFGFKPVPYELLPADKIVYKKHIHNEAPKTFIVFKK